MKNFVKSFSILTILFCFSCQNKVKTIDINKDGESNDCSLIKKIIKSDDIKTIKVIRPLGKLKDTTAFILSDIESFYGPRIFTLGTEYFLCRDIDSRIKVLEGQLVINYRQTSFNYGGSYNQEFVDNFWESDNCNLLGKPIPSFQVDTYGGEKITDQDFINKNNKTLLHFGFLGCQGCMVEQNRIFKLMEKHPNINFVNITPDSKEKLNKYLVANEGYYYVLPPYKKSMPKQNAPIIIDEKRMLEKLFGLTRGYPKNFLINEEGIIESCGFLSNIFKDDNVYVSDIISVPYQE